MPELIERSTDMPLRQNDVDRINRILKNGKLVVYPTSTLYGFGASIYSEAGMKKLWDVKLRPAYMPFSIMAAVKDIQKLCVIPESARPFFDTHDIGVTAIFTALETVQDSIVYKGTLAVRLPCSELCKSIVDAAGPITATSANVHGKGAPISIAQAKGQLGDFVELYIDGGVLGGTPTTLVDFTGQEVKVLREGMTGKEEVFNLYGR